MSNNVSNKSTPPLTLRLRVTPHASANAIVGWLGDTREELSLKVTAVAEGGKANAAVIQLLARELKIPKSAVSIQRGETSRHKLVAIDIDHEVFNTWLEQF